jgi:FkbM family methyltransferase
MSNDWQPTYARLEEQYFGEDMHEKAEILRLPSVLNGVTTFVDVGSSLGQYAYFASKTLRNAHLYCIEADPFKVIRLMELTSKWQVDTDNYFHVINKAVADTSGKISIFVPADHASSAALFPLEDDMQHQRRWDQREVECTTLDELFGDHSVEFIKIDVEGGEYRVLLGAKKLLESGKPKVLMEVAPWGDIERSYKPSDVFILMAKYGYGFKIFERHYLFFRARHKVLAQIKNRSMGLVLDHPYFKNVLKKLLFQVRQLSRARSRAR